MFGKLYNDADIHISLAEPSTLTVELCARISYRHTHIHTLASAFTDLYLPHVRVTRFTITHIHIDRQTDRQTAPLYIHVDIETLNSLKLLFFSSLFPADENEMLILNVILVMS